MRLRVGVRTDVGRVRTLNEDGYLIRAEQGLFVVCDGMGGAPAGEVASEIAIRAIGDALDGPGFESDRSRGARGCLPQTSRLTEAVRRSNQLIYEQARKNAPQAGMGTTVVGAWIGDSMVSVAHVGDSRAYLWHDESLEPLTRDHSLAEAHPGAALLEGDREALEQQNLLLRVLGRQPEVEVDVNEVPMQRGDYLLLCSDGLTRMVPEQTVAHAIGQLRHPQQICDYLVDAANSNGGADNITVVVVGTAGAWWHRPWWPWRRANPTSS